jgi:hypothetical protein
LNEKSVIVFSLFAAFPLFSLDKEIQHYGSFVSSTMAVQTIRLVE